MASAVGMLKPLASSSSESAAAAGATAGAAAIAGAAAAPGAARFASRGGGGRRAIPSFCFDAGRFTCDIANSMAVYNAYIDKDAICDAAGQLQLFALQCCLQAVASMTFLMPISLLMHSKILLLLPYTDSPCRWH